MADGRPIGPAPPGRPPGSRRGLRGGRGVSTPHRAEAFDAARYCIDTLKHTVPIWKRETWAGGTDWSVCSHEAEDVGDMIPLGEAQELVLEACRKGTPTSVPIDEALGCVVAAPVTATEPCSAFRQLVKGRLRPASGGHPGG